MSERRRLEISDRTVGASQLYDPAAHRLDYGFSAILTDPAPVQVPAVTTKIRQVFAWLDGFSAATELLTPGSKARVNASWRRAQPSRLRNPPTGSGE